MTGKVHCPWALAAAVGLALLAGCRAPDAEQAPADDNRIAETGETSASATDRPELRSPASFFDVPRAELLILGVFHFKDAGLDDYKPQFEVDILSPERQREVAEVLDRLEAFAPTKIAVEWGTEHQEIADERYRAYLAGELELGSNEVYQLGFRLARRLGHERVYTIDAQGRRYGDPPPDRDAAAKRLGREKELEESPWDERFTALYEYGDRLKTRQTLREHLLFLNDDERVRVGHGHYLVDGFKLADGEDYAGPDHLSGWWYNRNLRIFANVLNLVDSPEERVLLVIGSGHLPILRHAALSSPEVELVEVAEVLGAPAPPQESAAP